MKKIFTLFMVLSSFGAFAQDTQQQPAPPQPAVQQNCPTGDFCFLNTSKKKKVVDILGPQSYNGVAVLFTITILPGEQGCFYDVPAVVQNIRITTYDVEEGGNNPLNFTPAVTHEERRQIRVKNCAKESDIKPLKL